MIPPRSTLLTLALALPACSEGVSRPSEPGTPSPAEARPVSLTEADLAFAYRGERPAKRRIGETDLVFELRNDRLEPLRYLRADETGDGPSFLVEVREGESTREASPWWCGQGLEFVELAPGETVEVLVPVHLMEGDGLRALVQLYGPEDDREPLLVARSPEVAAR